MYICLSCKEEASARKDGSCPNCWERVELYTAFDGTKLFVPVGEDTPPMQLLKYWFGETSEAMSGKKNMRIVFTIHPSRQKSRYQKELSIAGKLLMEADWDIELAKDALGKVVHTAWKIPTTLTWVGDDYNAMLAVARAERERIKTVTSEDYTRAQIEATENVWE